MARLFFALHLSNDIITSALQPVIDNLVVYQNELKVVEPQNFHITIQFLGEVNDDQQQELLSQLDAVDIPLKKIPLQIKGIGAFPTLENPQVLWAGIKTDMTKLLKIVNPIIRMTNGLGFQQDKKSFKPHLTLARVRNKKNLPESCIRKLEQYESVIFTESNFNEIQLVQSILYPHGPEYVTVKKISLN